ncbi:arsenate reductase (glutaredoxin) [Sulfurimonas sp.]
MAQVEIWHNPRCSKSRQALAILEELETPKSIIKYLESHPSKEDIKKVCKMLGCQGARDMMRTKESIYKELNLQDETDEERLFGAMAEHPKLIERPIIIKGTQAIIARPPEKAKEFLNS